MRLVSSKFCLSCLGCCRFHSKDTIWLPYNIKPVSHEDFYLCPHLDFKTNKCKIYAKRPLDCKIYPFLLTIKNNKTYLALDKKCLYLEEHLKEVESHKKELPKYLSKQKIKNFIKIHPDFIKEYDKDDLIYLEQVKCYE